MSMKENLKALDALLKTLRSQKDDADPALKVLADAVRPQKAEIEPPAKGDSTGPDDSAATGAPERQGLTDLGLER